MRTFLLFLALSTPLAALADVIPPGHAPEPPPSCDPGAHPARPMRGHGWTCEVNPTCADDAACPAGRCVETALCVLGSSAYGACRDGDVCSVGECARARRCVPRPRPAASSGLEAPAAPGAPAAAAAASVAGLCWAGHAPRAPWLWLGAAGLAFALRRSRR
jgi:hypothetical protein